MGSNDAPSYALHYYLGIASLKSKFLDEVFMIMSKYERWWRSFKKNIIKKKKFKAYFQYYIDSEYRAQINRLFEITKDCTSKTIEYVPVWQLEHGHKITYPEYELQLMRDDSVDLEPIRVVQQGIVFVVIDGNHRLNAIRSRATRYGTQLVLCEVLK